MVARQETGVDTRGTACGGAPQGEDGERVFLVQIHRDLPLGTIVTGLPLVVVAACALVDDDGRVLISRRPEGKPLAGLWEFPGGKVEPDERPEIALIRELKEELSIDVSEACLAPLTFA